MRLHPLEGSCAGGCHALANEIFSALAHDSLGLTSLSAYRSEALAADGGHAWMPPGGNHDAGRLRQQVQSYAESEASVPAITECPIPKRLTGPVEFELHCPTSADGPEGSIEVRWHYVNDFGQVPGRDDVRFDVALAFDVDADLPLGTRMDDPHEGLGMHADVAQGIDVVRNLAADGRGGSMYRMRVPMPRGVSERRLDLQPKRFCFEEPDRRPYSHARPMRVRADLDCEL